MLAKIAAVLVVLISALTAPVIVSEVDATPAPAPAVQEIGDQQEAELSAETPTPNPAPAGRQCIKIVYSGHIRTCGEWGPAAPIVATPQNGYPAP